MSSQSPVPQPRAFCFACQRTAEHCLCGMIPRINNETPLLILQHRRERKHRFNSVKLLERSLQNLTVKIGYPAELRDEDLQFRSRPALIYPADGAEPIESAGSHGTLNQLILLDGTWHHAKTFLRDIPALADLPKFRLSPNVARRFKIRREPTATSASTLEAAVTALQLLEPHNPLYAQLLGVFDTMVQQQLDHPNSRDNWRVKRPRVNSRPKLPPALGGDGRQIIVAYGEAEPRLEQVEDQRRPVCWMAQRVGTGEKFCAFLKGAERISQQVLKHYELPASHFEEGMSDAKFAEQWRQFVGPSDVVVVYNKGTSRLLDAVGLGSADVILKEVCANIDQRVFPSLQGLLDRKGISPEAPQLPGRAGQRLADTLALVWYLRLRYR